MDQHKSSVGKKILKESLIWRRLLMVHLEKPFGFKKVDLILFKINKPARAVNPKKAIGAQQAKFVNTCKLIAVVKQLH